MTWAGALYGENEPRPSIIVEFLLGGLWGAVSVYSIAGLFVWWHWITLRTMLISGIAAGFIVSSYFA